MSVLVFADAYKGKLSKAANEAVTYAKKIADGSGANVVAVSFGSVAADALASLGNYGASKVVVNRSISDVDGGCLANLVADVAQTEGAKVIVFSHDFTGKSVAPRVAAKMNAGIVSGAVELPDTTDGFKVKKAVFSGKAFAHYAITSDVKVVSVLPNSIQPEATGSPAEVAEHAGNLGVAGVTVKEFKAKGGEGIPLTEAELVVSAGRGLKDPGNWGMIEDLATELGAATACSRPVADIGWRPHHEHVVHSFSNYKNVLGDRRFSFTKENIKGIMVIRIFYKNRL